MHAVDFVQESQLLLPSSDSAISRSPGTLPGNNPDCIPVNDVVRMTQHAQGNGKPQAVLPANLGTLLSLMDIFKWNKFNENKDSDILKQLFVPIITF